ncbi:MAG: hypothetical protein U9P38_01875 [Campylobacterota bacterium]|nr:hypothetical protein [Campylobacterota bacterium]
MKKIYLAVLLSLILLLLLPIIGNSFAQNILNKKIENLQSQGITLKKTITDSSYLSTKKEYHLLYTKSGEEMVIGVGVEYSNILFNKEISIEIYPISFSEEIMKNREFSQFLKDKSFLSHIDYNLVTQDFSGYIKDIKQQYSLQNSTTISILLLNTRFDGKGDLTDPEILNSTIKQLSIDISEGSKKRKLHIKDLFSSLIVDNKDIKLQLTSKNSFDSLEFTMDEKKFQFLDFNYSLNVTEIDKDSFMEFQDRLATDATDIEQIIIKLLSKGIDISIDDFSIKNIVINNQSFDGFKLSSKFLFAKDSDLANKFKNNPIKIRSNIQTEMELHISKKIFNELVKTSSMIGLMKLYAKERGDNYIFKVMFKDDKLKVNSKVLSL